MQVSGFQAGQVKSIGLQPNGVLVTFTVADDIRLGENTEAAIKTTVCWATRCSRSLLAVPVSYQMTIPMNRTTSPYQLPDAVGDLTATISGLNTDQLSGRCRHCRETLQRHPAATQARRRWRRAILPNDQPARRTTARSAGQRRKATTVLAQRTDQIVAAHPRHQRACWPRCAAKALR